MDYRKLVADGEYKKEDLNGVNRAFVEGIEYVAEELDYYYSSEETEDDFSNTLTNIKREIIEKVVEEIKEYVEVIAAETTVEMLDGQEEEENANEEIIRALNCRQHGGMVVCGDCSMFRDGYDCTRSVCASAIAVITRQQTEIERLNNELNGMNELVKLAPKYGQEE